MKKTIFIVLFAFCLTCSAAASGNPFVDLPPNHWARDAVVQMAAEGLLAGYPDGTFKGTQPMTRYEVASILARALRNVDMEYATKEQAELIRRMGVEFQEELELLGLVVHRVEERTGTLEDRLGGWRISGNVRLDANFLGDDSDGLGTDDMTLSRARLELSRRFGEDESVFFYAQLNSYPDVEGIRLTKFYSRFDLPWGVRATAGRFSMDFETDKMAWSTGRMGYYGQGAWFTDLDHDGLGFSKNFAAGTFDMYVVRRSLNSTWKNAWNIAARFAWDFNEHFTMDIGLDYNSIDNDEDLNGGTENASTVDSVTTVWVAPKLEVTDDIGLRGAVYAQHTDYNDRETGDPDDNPMAWRLILEVRQTLLKFTSLWVEFDRLDKNFILTSGAESLLLTDRDERDFFSSANLGGDLSIWRVGLNQIWDDRWSSWLYYARYSFSDYPAANGGTVDPTMDEISAGVEYRMNQHVTFSLAYFYHKFNEDAFLPKNRILRFRTSVWF